VEGLATRLSTVNSVKEVEAVEASLTSLFSTADKLSKSLDTALTELGAKDEKKELGIAVASMGSTKSLIFGDNGIISKTRNQLAMKEKAAKATGAFRDIVLKQAGEAKNTMTQAKGVQEQSIIGVNRSVNPKTQIDAAGHAKHTDKKVVTMTEERTKFFRKIPRKFRHTLTVDIGREFSQFKVFETKAKVKVYFADPYSAWQRGANENSNGLIRYYFRKGIDFRGISEKEVALVVKKLNNRPRKCLELSDALCGV
jgi:hypothetical protein